MNNKIKSRCEASIETMMRAIVVLKAVTEGTPMTVACTRINMNLNQFRLMLNKLSKINIDKKKIIDIPFEDLLTWEDHFIQDLVGSTGYALPDFKQSYDTALKILSPREQEIIRLYYEDGLTLEQIGTKIGVTRQRVDQKKQHAFTTIRKHECFDNFIYGTECATIKEYRDSIAKVNEARTNRLTQLNEQIRNNNLQIKQMSDLANFGITEIKDTSILALDLDARSYNCLHRANIKTIGELINKTEKELMALPLFGRKCLTITKEQLRLRYGLTLSPKIE